MHNFSRPEDPFKELEAMMNTAQKPTLLVWLTITAAARLLLHTLSNEEAVIDERPRAA